MSSFNDFDDDLDDILLSEEEAPKKPIKKEELPKNQSNTILPKSEPINSFDIFDDVIDPLDPINNKTKPSKPTTSANFKLSSSKPAKSVLDDLLSPSKRLNELDLPKSSQIPLTKSLQYNEKLQMSTDNLPAASDKRPATMETKFNSIHDKSSNLTNNKRTVRFSNEALFDTNNERGGDEENDVDDFFDNFDRKIERKSSLTDLQMPSRPTTAPTQPNPTKFVSRFESAEFEEIPKIAKSDSRSIFSSDNDFSLMNNLDSKRSKESSDSKLHFPNTDTLDGEFDKLNKDSVSEKRKNPKKKLSEFLQSSQEDLLIQSTPQPIKSFDNDSDYLDSRFDMRPKTAAARSSRMSQNTDLNISFLETDRPKTGHIRGVETIQTQPEATRLVESNPIDASYSDTRLRKLQAEKEDLLFKIDMMEKRFHEDKDISDKNYKNRVEMLEESSNSKIKRLTEENNILTEQNRQKMKMLEDERLEMRKEISRRQEEQENHHKSDLMRIQDQHRHEMEKLKLEHEELIDRLKRAREREDATVRDAQPTTAQLQTVLSQVSSGAEGLVGLKRQLEEKWSEQVREKDEELRNKDEHLKRLEQRLDKERDENSQERARLQSLISKLDIQLRDQTKIQDEDKWSLKQEQSKLMSLQSSLEKERDHIMVEKENIRKINDEYRQKLLDEQRQLFDQLYEEKRQLAEERTKLTREMTKWSETNQYTSGKKSQELAEIEGMKNALVEERLQLEKQKEQWLKEKESYMTMKSEIELKTHEMSLKSDRLNQLEKELETRQNLLNNKEAYYHELESKADEAFRKARDLHSSHQTQLTEIQNQLVALSDKERTINKELIQLERSKKDLKDKEGKVICQRCSNPLRDSALGSSIGNFKIQSFNSLNKTPNQINTSKGRLGTNSDNEVQHALEYSNFIASQMEEERLMKSLKMEADNDREYLNQEQAYLDSLTSGKQRYSVWS